MNWLSGGGEMGALIRAKDWSRTSLGPLANWPQSLRTSVSLCLSSTFPILVAWGPEHVQIYNDAYRPICGGKHPEAVGEPFKVCWATALPVVGDKFDRAQQGEGTYISDQRMFLDRYGYLEEAFMTFSFSPIRDESGTVGGIFHPITETTAQVLNARRTQSLRDLSAAIGVSRTIAEVGACIADQYPGLVLDVPFLLFYEIDAGGAQLTLRGSAGLAAGAPLAPSALAFDDACWPFASAAQARSAQQVDALAERIGASRCGPYEQPPRSALVLPIALPGQQDLFGFVVAGVSACRALDADYLNFYALLGGAVNTAVGNVVAYEQELRRAEELAQIDRAKTAFFSNVSHEFRTPLTLILGPLDDALADQGEALGPQQRKRVELTHRNALRLLKLVNSLLDFSRIEAGRVQASYAPVDLRQVTAELAGVFESAMAKGGLAYVLDLHHLHEPVYIDRDMWEKIVFNLLSNAFKFTLQGQVTVTLARHGDMARLSVIDTGGGIPPQELPRMFERFHRIEGAPGRTYEGTGIGLALIQELVRLHGGAIAVSSVLGEGSRFDVDIPFGHAHLAPERVRQQAGQAGAQGLGAAFVGEALRWLPDHGGAAQAAPALAAAPAPARALTEAGSGAAGTPRPRVLVADDNNDMRAYVKSLLEAYADVTVCADGEEAFALLLRDPPDLLLSDVMMPRLDGFGLIARIRASDTLRHLPVMLLSARAGDEAKVEGLRAGADDYLVKPFAASELQARVQRQLALARERHEATVQQAYFRTLVDASPVMLWTTDAAGNCTYLSQRWYDFTGRSQMQDLGQGWLENIHPDDLAHTGEQYLAASRAQSPFSIDYRLRRRDGVYRWAIDAGAPRFDQAGQFIGFVGTVIDVHVRKLLQERLEQVSLAGDIGVWYADLPLTHFELNTRMAEHLGLSGQRNLSLDALLARVAPGDRQRVADAIAHALDGCSSLDLEFCSADRADGAAPRWLRAVGWCELDEAGTPQRFDGVTLDVSTHKVAQLELQRLASALADKNRMQNEFLVTLAHELRNPLAPIRTGLELMRTGSPAVAARDVRGMMARQVDHMVHLVDDLLDMARLTQGKLTLRRDDVTLAAVLKDAVDMSMPLVSAGGHRLATHLPEQPVALHVDRHRVAQVLSNLINNAAKYTPRDGVIEVDARLEVRGDVQADAQADVQAGPAQLVITVSDNGVGIAPEVLPTLFDMYTQAPGSEGMAQGGLGVGLNLVQRLVELHGGTVQAASDGVGRGSRFTVHLPLTAPGAGAGGPPDDRASPATSAALAPYAATPRQDAAPAATPAADKLRVMVVDDNADAAESLSALMEFSGYDVLVAYDGASALAKVDGFRPHVVFLDIGLPDQSGFEVAPAMRRIGCMADAILIALTGWGTEQDKQRSRQAGFDQHLTKPVDFVSLQKMLAEVEAGRQ